MSRYGSLGKGEAHLGKQMVYGPLADVRISQVPGQLPENIV